MELKDIKFKAKRLDNGEWIEGSLVKGYINSKEQTYIIPIFNKAGDIKTIEVNPSTICQFTGLRDKEGNEVWENDILIDDEKIIGYIIFKDSSFYIVNKYNFPVALFYLTYENIMLNYKVISNKFND